MSQQIYYTVAIGTAPVPGLLFSMGTIIYRACVFPKIQSRENFSESVLPYLLTG